MRNRTNKVKSKWIGSICAKRVSLATMNGCRMKKENETKYQSDDGLFGTHTHIIIIDSLHTNSISKIATLPRQLSTLSIVLWIISALNGYNNRFKR